MSRLLNTYRACGTWKRFNGYEIGRSLKLLSATKARPKTGKHLCEKKKTICMRCTLTLLCTLPRFSANRVFPSLRNFLILYVGKFVFPSFLRQLIEAVSFEFRLETISWLCKVISTSFSMIFAVIRSICLSRLYDRMKFRETQVFLSVLSLWNIVYVAWLILGELILDYLVSFISIARVFHDRELICR